MNNKLVQKAFLNYQALKYKETFKDFEEDCSFIRKVIYESKDIALTLEECYIFWKNYSYLHAVNWFLIDRDDDSKKEIVDSFLYFVKKYEVYDERCTEADEWSHERHKELKSPIGELKRLIKKAEDFKKGI